MIEDQTCVLIYNPISGHGHLDSWNAIFVSLLLDRGWKVLALTPDAQALVSRLAWRDCIPSNDFQILDWNALARASIGNIILQNLRRLWRRWSAFAEPYFLRKVGSETLANMWTPTYLKNRIFGLTVPTLFRISRYLKESLRRHGNGAKFADSRLDAETNYLEPAEFAVRVNAALKKCSWTPALVLNMYMDLYRTDAGSWHHFSAINRLPWAGIRFVPNEAPTEAYYALPSLKGMCFLDERICANLRDSIPDKHFEFLPDITDTALPEAPGPVAQEIRKRAMGREIVFLGGSIGGHKNLSLWYEIIRLADPQNWFFVQIGELHRDTFAPQDRLAYENIASDTPENLFRVEQFLPDESEFNEIICASSVIFAVYRDFRISSNMLSKAAAFRKPIIVSERYLMGDRVRRYGIGRCVPETDATRVLEALSMVCSRPIADENFSKYQSDFSQQAMADRLHDFLMTCVKQDRQ